MQERSFHSKFGGLWIDRSDWEKELRKRRRNRSVTAVEATDIRSFVRSGFVIFKQAASRDHVDAFRQEIERSFREGNPDVLYQRSGEMATKPLLGPIDSLGTRVVDSFVPLPQALDLFHSDRLLRFLTLIFDDTPLLFQSLSFDQGSQQGLHQDTAYVVVDRPMELAACWIALEDVQPGSGELMYIPGSHRYPDFNFGSGSKHWTSEIDGQESHQRWGAWIQDQAAARGLSVQRFLARKGDVLVWHADLAHGGAPVINTGLTRRSLVGHFCPSACQPNYFKGNSARSTVLHWGELAYASGHYDIESRPPVPPPAVAPASRKRKDRSVWESARALFAWK